MYVYNLTTYRYGTYARTAGLYDLVARLTSVLAARTRETFASAVSTTPSPATAAASNNATQANAGANSELIDLTLSQSFDAALLPALDGSEEEWRESDQYMTSVT
jgi:hypothetical protein